MRSWPKWRALALWAGAAAVVLLFAFAWLTQPRTQTPGDIPSHHEDLANGERLFHAGGCAACHGEGLAGGLELATPFGIFRVPNITADPAAGIGGWRNVDFINAMRFGVSPERRHYYPAFPYTSYAGMSLTDLLDLKAYLDTFPPVRLDVADHDIGFPWNLRRGIGLWKRIYLDAAPVLEVAAGDTVLEHGRYLVESVGHCAECHTPRGRFGGLLRSHWLAGGPSLDGEGKVPNITPHADGLADWSQRDIERYLGSGFTPDYDTVGGSMAKVQENLAKLPADDRAAIAAYLKALPPLPNPSG